MRAPFQPARKGQKVVAGWDHDAQEDPKFIHQGNTIVKAAM